MLDKLMPNSRRASLCIPFSSVGCRDNLYPRCMHLQQITWNNFAFHVALSLTCLPSNLSIPFLSSPICSSDGPIQKIKRSLTHLNTIVFHEQALFIWNLVIALASASQLFSVVAKLVAPSTTRIARCCIYFLGTIFVWEFKAAVPHSSFP